MGSLYAFSCDGSIVLVVGKDDCVYGSGGMDVSGGKGNMWGVFGW